MSATRPCPSLSLCCAAWGLHASCGGSLSSSLRLIPSFPYLLSPNQETQESLLAPWKVGWEKKGRPTQTHSGPHGHNRLLLCPSPPALGILNALGQNLCFQMAKQVFREQWRQQQKQGHLAPDGCWYCKGTKLRIVTQDLSTETDYKQAEENEALSSITCQNFPFRKLSTEWGKNLLGKGGFKTPVPAAVARNKPLQILATQRNPPVFMVRGQGVRHRGRHKGIGSALLYHDGASAERHRFWVAYCCLNSPSGGWCLLAAG